MSDINTGQSAFPLATDGGHFSEGMTLRQYASIKLKVPDSGADWLDGMIRKSLRDRLAAKAMQGLLANNNIDAQQIAKAAYIVADAMLKEMKA